MLLQTAYIVSIVIHLTMFTLSTVMIACRTPKSMKTYSVFLFNINFWYHFLALFMSTLAKQTLHLIDGTICFSYVSNIGLQLPRDFYITGITCGIFNSFVALLLAFIYLFYLSSQLTSSHNIMTEYVRPTHLWFIAVLLHAVICTINLVLLFQPQPAVPMNYTSSIQPICVVTRNNITWMVNWATYFFVVCLIVTLFIWFFVLGIRRRLRQSEAHSTQTASMYRSFLITVFLMSCTPFVLFVIPILVTVIELVLEMTEVMHTLIDLINLLMPLQASVNSAIIVISMKPYRRALLRLIPGNQVNSTVVVSMQQSGRHYNHSQN